MPALSFSLAAAALLAVATAACTPRNAAMTAQDPQARCDELYDLVNSPRWAALAGKTTQEIAELLGRPDRISTLERNGVTWTRVVYTCQSIPARATAEERAAIAQGWQFSPTLLFRDRVVVPEATFDREVIGDARTAVPPPELRFREGGEFP